MPIFLLVQAFYALFISIKSILFSIPLCKHPFIPLFPCEYCCFMMNRSCKTKKTKATRKTRWNYREPQKEHVPSRNYVECEDSLELVNAPFNLCGPICNVVTETSFTWSQLKHGASNWSALCMIPKSKISSQAREKKARSTNGYAWDSICDYISLIESFLYMKQTNKKKQSFGNDSQNKMARCYNLPCPYSWK